MNRCLGSMRAIHIPLHYSWCTICLRVLWTRRRTSRSRALRFVDATTTLTWIAHALAWAAGAWLALGPVYQSVSIAATIPGEPAEEVSRSTATLLEVNGLHGALLLLVPVILTGIAVLAIQFTNKSQTSRAALLWGPVVLLLGFCFVAILSIGPFYLPAALVLLVAALTDFKRQEANA